MAAEFTTKVRLVRCPKCRLLLPELPNFQVYRCGGCSAILQAKNGLRSRSTGLNGTVAAQMNGLGGSSEDTASINTSSIGILPDSGECSSDQIDEKNQSKSSGECSFERNTERDESKFLEGSESSSSGLKGKAPAVEECYLERRNEGDGSCSSEGIESSRSSLKASPPVSGECSLERRRRDGSNSSVGIESSSSSPKAKAPDSGEYSLERSHERDESKPSQIIESISCPKADLGGCSLERNIERGDSKSSEGIESCSLSPKVTFPNSGECSLDQNNEKNQNKFSEDEEFSSSSHKVILPESGEHTLIQNNGMDPDKLSVEDYGGEQLQELKLPIENQNYQSDQNGYGEPGKKPLGVPREISSTMEFENSESKASLPITATSSEALKDDESLPLAPNLEVDIVVEIDSDSTSSSRLNAVPTRGSSSIYSAHMPPRDSISSDIIISSPDEQSNEIVDFNMDVDSSAVNIGATRESGVTAHMPAQESSSAGTLTSSPNEQLLKEPHNSVPTRLDHLKSSNTFETTDFLSPRSEFSAAVNDRSKSPGTRSHPDYDGSVSSYDGTDQFYNHNLHTLQDAYTAPNLVQSKERYIREKFLAESMGNRGSGLPNQARSSMSDKNGHAMKYRNWDQDEMLPPRIPRHPSRDHARVQMDEYMPRVASLQGDSLGGYGNGRFRNQMYNELQSNSNYQSDRSVSAAVDKLTLLRMVCELQTQVHSLNVQASRQEKHIPQYHNYDTSEEELFHALNHPRDLRRSRAGSHYVHQQSQYRPIPFSSEATTSRQQVDSPFMHHYPQDRQFSAPLPLPIRSNTNELRRVHPGYASSQWDTETVSEDQIHNSHEVKKYYGEKQQMPKRHFLPIAGGAPILICYNCFNPLQIPADFLLLKRKCHRLQCGACSKVLKFSLHKRIHILPYGVNAIGPPPSEVEDNSNGVNVDPVSFSDDYGYGLSYCKSGSTEAGDHAGNIAPSNSLESTIVHETNMSYGSNNPSRGSQEIVLRRSQSQNKDRNPVERFMTARTSHVLKSDNHSSKMKELLPKTSSPLHRLMGYRSPSQVIRGISLSRLGSKNSRRN